MFVPGQVYRRRELHVRYGGQQQGGISTPAKLPIILLFTGESGGQYGYKDGWQESGLFLYTGEGQRGDMRFAGGNRAIRYHWEEGKDIHLFEQAKRAHVRYVGQFVATGHQMRIVPDLDKANRNAIVFELTPLEEFTETDLPVEAVHILPILPESSTLAQLRALALSDSAEEREPLQRQASIRRRSRAVRLYVLRRANGICEACKKPAPFLTAAGEPYLEPHHIRRLSDGGPDHPSAVAAVCPNCHRKAHYSGEADVFNAVMLRTIKEIERDDANH